MREDVGIRKDFEWRNIGKLIHRRNGGKAFLTKDPLPRFFAMCKT